jgi:dihydroneopterin aldolase
LAAQPLTNAPNEAPARRGPRTGPHHRHQGVRARPEGRRRIGVYDHEHGRQQPLIADVELDVAASHCERAGRHGQLRDHRPGRPAIAAEGHIGLVETFAERLAQACFEDSRVTRARVRVEKPLGPGPPRRRGRGGNHRRPGVSPIHAAPAQRPPRPVPARDGLDAGGRGAGRARGPREQRFPLSSLTASAWPSRARAAAAGC